jgi:hypothetical protein
MEYHYQCLEMALGKLGWTEKEFYTSSPKSFFFAIRGYFSKLQDESLAVRNSATIIYRSLGGKSDINSIWPLNGEKKDTKIEMDQETYDRIKQIHNLK